MTAPDPRLGEIAARLAAASEGPWAIDTADFDGYAVFMDDGITWGRAYVCNGLNQGEDEGKADAEFIANAPADVSYLLAALADRDAKLAKVEARHRPVPVYEYDYMNGVFKVDDAGEQIEMKTLCSECTGDSVLELIGDCEYDESDCHDETNWPCPSVVALHAADTTGGEE